FGTCSLESDEVNDEDEGLATEEVTRARGAVGQVWRDGELTAAANLHSGDTLLPALDEHAEGELGCFATAPRRVELFARLEVNAGVVDRDGSARLCLGAVAHDDVVDLELGGGSARGSVELRLHAIESHAYIFPCEPWQCHRMRSRRNLAH